MKNKEYKSPVFPMQSLLLWSITIPCFQVLITGLLDHQKQRVSKRERASGKGGVGVKK